MFWKKRGWPWKVRNLFITKRMSDGCRVKGCHSWHMSARHWILQQQMLRIFWFTFLFSRILIRLYAIDLWTGRRPLNYWPKSSWILSDFWCRSPGKIRDRQSIFINYFFQFLCFFECFAHSRCSFVKESGFPSRQDTMRLLMCNYFNALFHVLL